MRKVRTLRHWRQQFEKNARFIWRRPSTFAGVQYKPGDDIPEALSTNKTKLRRFWESKWIELAAFEGGGNGEEFGLNLPDGVTIPDDVNIEHGKGSWFILTITGRDGEMKLNGKKALTGFIEKLVTTRAEESKAAEEAAAAETLAVADLLQSVIEHNFTMTAEIVKTWTEDQRAEVELYFEALDDGDADDPDEVPEMLPQPPTVEEIQIEKFIETAAEHGIAVTAELAARLTDEQWDLSIQYFELKTDNPEAELEYPVWLPVPSDDT